jgi:predicted DNA-binding transcriptional regulator AlpA
MANANKDVEGLVNEHYVAQFFGVSVATVRRWRLLKQGPRSIKVSRSAVRYRLEDLNAYLDARPTGGGEQNTKAR